MTPSNPIPVTVIGGYLGAGKTTLINHALRHADGARLAILVNEFGELAIDEDLIIAQGDDIVSIAGGCICCSFGDNLVGALIDLAQLVPRPDQILIEASGVAIPASIAASLSLLVDFRLNSIVVLADAETVQAMARDKYLGDTIQRQLHDADLVVLSKPDLVKPDQRAAVTAWLQNAAPKGKIVPADHGSIPLEVLLGAGPPSRLRPKQPHSDAAFESIVCHPAQPLDARQLANDLARGDFGIVRAKGFVTDLTGETRLIQVVGQRSDVTAAAAVAPAIVCIGLSGQLRRAALIQRFRALRTQGEAGAPTRPA